MVLQKIIMKHRFKAVTAGNDMDMESRSYINNLSKLVKDKKVNIQLIDDAVKRILTKKFEMGLFDDPFKFSNKEREQQQWNNNENLAGRKINGGKKYCVVEK